MTALLLWPFFPSVYPVLHLSRACTTSKLLMYRTTWRTDSKRFYMWTHTTYFLQRTYRVLIQARIHDHGFKGSLWTMASKWGRPNPPSTVEILRNTPTARLREDFSYDETLTERRTRACNLDGNRRLWMTLNTHYAQIRTLQSANFTFFEANCVRIREDQQHSCSLVSEDTSFVRMLGFPGEVVL